jgi:hypothetical protein
MRGTLSAARLVYRGGYLLNSSCPVSCARSLQVLRRFLHFRRGYLAFLIPSPHNLRSRLTADNKIFTKSDYLKAASSHTRMKLVQGSYKLRLLLQ